MTSEVRRVGEGASVDLDEAARGGPHDFRLAVGAVVAWVTSSVAIGGPPSRAVILTALAATVGLGALLVARHASGWWAAVALAAFCTVLVLAPLSARLAQARASPLARLASERSQATVEMTVESDPRPLAAKGVAGTPRVAVDANANTVEIGQTRVRVTGRVLVLGAADQWRDVLPGQRVRLDATLQPPLGGDLLVATVEADTAPTKIGQPPWWQRAAGTVRSSLRRASSGLPTEVSGLLPGLVDGDTSGLDPVLAERFRIAGLTHLVAVSGSNCSILIGAALLVLRRARVGPRTCAAVATVLLIGFVLIARPSPSVLRAALMAAIALFALASGRQRTALPALAATVLALLVWQPQLAVDAGFAMSALATSALIVIAPDWAAALRRRRVPTGVAEPLAVAAAAHVVTAPVIAAISGRVSLVAIPANLLAEPVVALTTVLGFAAAAIAPVWLGGGTAFAELAGWPCRWLIAVADLFGGLHGATVPWPGGVGGGVALLVVMATIVWLAGRGGVRRVLVGFAVVAVIVQIPVRAITSGWPPPGWIFVACDVGQGDALVLPAGPHAAVVVDSGPEPVAIDRCLDDLSIDSVPLLVLTHYHLDHVGGIAGVFHGRTVGEVITGPLADPAAGVSLVRTVLAGHHQSIGQAPIGQSVDVGGVHLQFVAPVVAFHGTRSDPNNSSVIMIATVAGERIMLPGDAEIEAQQAVLASGVDVHADVLKVPHHGSAYSDPAFLAAIHAKLGVISAGLNNDYGLPSPVLLAELARLNVPVRRTDHDGDVAVVFTGGRLSTVSRGTRASTVGLARSPPVRPSLAGP